MWLGGGLRVVSSSGFSPSSDCALVHLRIVMLPCWFGLWGVLRCVDAVCVSIGCRLASPLCSFVSAASVSLVVMANDELAQSSQGDSRGEKRPREFHNPWDTAPSHVLDLVSGRGLFDEKGLEDCWSYISQPSKILLWRTECPRGVLSLLCLSLGSPGTRIAAASPSLAWLKSCSLLRFASSMRRTLFGAISTRRRLLRLLRKLPNFVRISRLAVCCAVCAVRCSSPRWSSVATRSGARKARSWR